METYIVLLHSRCVDCVPVGLLGLANVGGRVPTGRGSVQPLVKSHRKKYNVHLQYHTQRP